MEYESQKNRILEMLKNNEFVCTKYFYADFIADPRRRICDLKKKYELEWRWCENPAHNHRGNMKEWRLIGQKDKVIVLSGYAAPKVLQEKLC